jgi:hypothetical protein
MRGGAGRFDRGGLAPHHNNKIKSKQNRKNMTDSTEILDLVDDSQSVFPTKDDMNHRLVLVWVTGKKGTRQGENGKYTWVETVTMVIDDGPSWTGQVLDSDTLAMREIRIPSVEAEGPTVLENFQFSFGGMVARLEQRINADGTPKYFKPMMGRIDSRPNSKKGMAPPFSILTPTAEDHELLPKFAAQIREISARMEKASAVVDEFDE